MAEDDLREGENKAEAQSDAGSDNSSTAFRQDISNTDNNDWKAATASARDTQLSSNLGLGQLSITGMDSGPISKSKGESAAGKGKPYETQSSGPISDASGATQKKDALDQKQNEAFQSLDSATPNNLARGPEGSKNPPRDPDAGDSKDGKDSPEKNGRPEKREQSDSIEPNENPKSGLGTPDFLVMNSPYPQSTNFSAVFNKGDQANSPFNPSKGQDIDLSVRKDGSWDGAKDFGNKASEDGKYPGLTKFNEEKYNEHMNKAHQDILKIGSGTDKWTPEKAQEINKVLNQVMRDLGQEGLNELVKQLEKDFQWGETSYLKGQRDENGNVKGVDLLHGQSKGFFSGDTHTAFDRASYEKNKPAKSADMDQFGNFRNSPSAPKEAEKKGTDYINKAIELAPKALDKALPPQGDGAGVGMPAKVLKKVTDDLDPLKGNKK